MQVKFFINLDDIDKELVENCKEFPPAENKLRAKYLQNHTCRNWF